LVDLHKAIEGDCQVPQAVEVVEKFNVHDIPIALLNGLKLIEAHDAIGVDQPVEPQSATLRGQLIAANHHHLIFLIVKDLLRNFIAWKSQVLGNLHPSLVIYQKDFVVLPWV
jgi:hypothetical protein